MRVPLRSSAFARLPKWVVFTVAVLGCELAGIIGSFFTTPAIPTWYDGLVKSAITPPSWVFAPVWTILFAMMGIALSVVWYANSRRRKTAAYTFFVVQLRLNMLWSYLFFGLQSPLFALVEIAVLWAAIVMTIVAFYPISRMAAWLLVPYLLWVSFASFLNFSLWQLNKVPPHKIELPTGYSLKEYTVSEILPVSCTKDEDCETPGSYLIRSNCPYTTLCLRNSCTVVCPTYVGEQ